MTTQKEASHPLFYRVGSRRMRRLMVVVTYGGFALFAAIVKVWSSTTAGWAESVNLLVIAGAILQLVWFVWLGRTYINAPRLADGELDERLLQVKNRAFRRAYLVFAPVAMTAWVLSLVALQLQAGDPGRVDAAILVYGVAVLAGTLPTSIVAWQEPDPLTGNDEPA